MSFQVNTTDDYHRHEMESLGWELTVCNMLQQQDSPARTILRNDQSFGAHLIALLEEHAGLKHAQSILEVGGGYGFIMHDILEKYNGLTSAMIDISPYLLEQQKKTLKDHAVTFILQDFLQIDPAQLHAYSHIIFNENIGDFDTAVNCTLEGLHMSENETAAEILRLIEKYQLEVPHNSPFNINLGAIQALELSCNAGAAVIYMSEHSCEAVVPDDFKEIISIPVSPFPEKISLKGHDEYTIKFSHLETIGRQEGYTVKRGPLADFIPFDYTDRIRFILRSHSQKDVHEIIRHFIEDLYKYEYILLTGKIQ